jgi:putative ABC transport system permease protein
MKFYSARPDALGRDVRAACRALMTSKRFTALAILCLGIGIGANTLVFSIVNGLFVRPLPFVNADGLFLVNEVRVGGGAERTGIPYPKYRAWHEQATPAVGDMAAIRQRGVTVSTGQDWRRIVGAEVSWNFFPLLGVRPAAGRELREGDDRLGAAPVVILSDRFWEENFGREPDVIGRSLVIDGRPHTVIAIMPEGFAFSRGQRLWIPLGASEYSSSNDQRSVTVYLRLGEEVSPPQARALLANVGQALEMQYSGENRGWTADLQPITAFVPSRQRDMIFLTMGAVGFVLLIACANVANLTLARGLARRRELAIRAAMGATIHNLIRQCILEGVLIGLLSVPVAMLLASWGLNRILMAIPEEAFRYDLSFPLDARVWFLSAAVGAVTGVLCGLPPALRLRRGLFETMREGGESTTGVPHRRLSVALVACEVALSVVLLVGASLFLRSFVNLLQEDGGLDMSRLMTLGLEIPADRYPSPTDVSLKIEDVILRLEGLTGVESAAASDLVPLRGGGSRALVTVEGRTTSPSERQTVLWGGITSGFFSSLDVPIVMGRRFTELEARSPALVAIVNSTMAQRLWPGESPIGKRFQLESDATPDWLTVIGVSGDFVTWDLSNRPVPSAYVPYPHVAQRNPTVVIRTTVPPELLVNRTRTVVRADLTVPVFDAQPMSALHRQIFWRNRLLNIVFSGFAIVALLLAALGVYGLFSYLVARRVREMGLRMALGAEPRDVVRLVMRQGLALVTAGIVIGVAGALALTTVLRGQLYEVSATDPPTIVTVALLMAGVGLVSSYVPARRAARVEPSSLLAPRADR